MRKDLLIIALGLIGTAGVAVADVVSVPETQTTAITLPAKGSSMSDVKKKYGEPRDRKAPVGGDTPKHPPITRWDYDGFVVIFEKDRVVDAVVPGAPAPLRNTAGLSPATNAPPPPAPPAVPAADPIIPEAPAAEPEPPVEPAAEAAPVMPESPPPAEEPPPAEASPPAEPPAEQMSPAPIESPPPEQMQDGPPTPK
jgi:hypothetical protein